MPRVNHKGSIYCFYCKLERIKPQKLFMSEFPKERLDPYWKPFYNANIDFFGPMTVTKKVNIMVQIYGVIFT